MRTEPSPGVVSRSLSGSVGTVLSRSTGLAQTIAVGAVLGATYLGNTYQAVNALPNLVYYQLLAGSLFASLLIPPLVKHLDAGDAEAASKLVRGFYGALLTISAAFALVLLALGPLLTHLLSVGAPNRAIATAQAHAGFFLLVLFLPQIALYVTAGTAGAVMNAHGRYGLPAAAPSLENVGMIATLLIFAVVFGTGTVITRISDGALLLLGLGTTAAVGVHAACVWFGAGRSGIRLIPSVGWRDPEVRAVLARITPTLAYTGMAALQILAVFVVANRMPGGLVAFQLALSFYYLPVALVTWPVARAVLPQLSRLHLAHDAAGFREELVLGVRLVSFASTPAAFAFAVLAVPLARAATFGQMGTPHGVRMVAISLATLAPGVIAEGWFIIGTDACYARHDPKGPLRSMAVRLGITLGCMVFAWRASPSASLPLLGLSLSVGTIAGAAHLWRGLGVGVPADLTRSLRRTLIATAAMLPPAYLVTVGFRVFARTEITEILAAAGAAAAGLVTYLWLQRRMHAPELEWLLAPTSAVRSNDLGPQGSST